MKVERENERAGKIEGSEMKELDREKEKWGKKVLGRQIVLGRLQGAGHSRQGSSARQMDLSY